MAKQKNMQRDIRKAVRVRDSISEEQNDFSDRQLNFTLLKLVFLRMIRELFGNLDVSQVHQSYRRLGLFGGGGAPDSDIVIEGHLESALQFDLGQRNSESHLDTRILFLGGLFEALKSQARRKRRGVYYTPFGLAQTITKLALDAFDPCDGKSNVSQLTRVKVLDNACGSGTFLFAVLEELLARIKAKADRVVLNDISVKTTRLDIIASHLLMHSLVGHDLDEDAIKVAEAQLWLALNSLASNAPLSIPTKNLRVKDTLVSGIDYGNYDIVIGNPPYMRLTSKDAKYKQAIKKLYSTTREYNTHALFVQASLSQLKQGGILSYLIHKNLLTLDTFSSLRQSLIESHNLIQLADCGPGVFRGVTAETAVIVLQRGPRQPPSSITLSAYDSKSEDCRATTEVDYGEYRNLISTWNNRYLMSIAPETIPYLKYMSCLPLLNSKVRIKRGIETGSNRHFIATETKTRGNWKPVLRGRDIAKYYAKNSSYLNHNLAKLAKPGRTDLLQIPKVVVQQNSEHPIASFDPGRFLVLNSVTYMTNANEDLLKSICVLLNSKLISWFFKTVMTNNAGLTVNLLPNNLGRIPIPFDIDVRLFSRLCDLLMNLRMVSDEQPEISARYRLWHEILAETLVVASYFPHLVEKKEIFDKIQSVIDSNACSALNADSFDDEVVASAKRVLNGFGFLQV
ncbi:MAG: Eco57I restriction-modification methylase domain-containing protein [Candidatus Thorarchaeota archaeon]